MRSNTGFWIGTEAEGAAVGTKTLFVEGGLETRTEKIRELLRVHAAQRVYFGAGRREPSALESILDFVRKEGQFVKVACEVGARTLEWFPHLRKVGVEVIVTLPDEDGIVLKMEWLERKAIGCLYRGGVQVLHDCDFNRQLLPGDEEVE